MCFISLGRFPQLKSYTTIAFFLEETGEYGDLELNHGEEEAEPF